jgi:hypothetical protein
MKKLILKSLITLISLLFISNSYSQSNDDYEIITSIINSRLQEELNIRQDTIYNKKGQIKRIKSFKLSYIYLERYTNTELRQYQPDILFNYLSKYSSFLTSDIFNDFIQKNTLPVRIDSLKGIQLEVRIGAGDYDVRNPVIGVSRPGINDNRDRALIYFSLLWGGRVGYGEYYLLQKTSKGWVIVERYTSWIT